MTYAETLAYLYQSQPAFHLLGGAAYKPGLYNTLLLMRHLHNPHQHFLSIHIGGTNGKGSTSHLLAAVLQAAGFRVGLYTSPHLVDFRERIRISGQAIPEKEVVAFVEKHRAFLEEIHPSFFETTMAMAFDFFARRRVDIAVIEVGLGGRLDSTNVITPLLSVITNIGFDHTEFLGTTLEAIAREKAGIIKPHIPCVIGESQPQTDPVFLQRAVECDLLGEGVETTDCRLWFADQCGYMRRRREQEAPECQLHGNYQSHNVQTVYVALQVLYHYTEWGQLHPLPTPLALAEYIRNGFAHVCEMTGLRGRWEVLQTSPLVICDTGHNAHGIRYVAQQLTALQQQRQCDLHIVFGMVSDKDVDVVLSLLPTDATYYFTQAHTHRAIPANELQAMWRTLHHELPNTQNGAYNDVPTAVSAALAAADGQSVVFIGGSNYVVGETLQMTDKCL